MQIGCTSVKLLLVTVNTLQNREHFLNDGIS